jgi:hypothetical protein
MAFKSCYQERLPQLSRRSFFICADECGGTAFHSHCALAALKNFTPSAPGPLAQAITFRAVGAGNSLVIQMSS